MEINSLDLEENRLKTFQCKTWSLSFISPQDLAKAGFYFVGPQYDEVKCYSCELQLCEWKKGDNPYYYHKLWAPYCPFIMNSEQNRLETFKNWPMTHLKPEILAKTGFYYRDTTRELQCNFCDSSFIDLAKCNNIVFEHLR